MLACFNSRASSNTQLRLLILDVSIQAQDNQSNESSVGKFALIGDVPYNEKDVWKLDNVIEEINSYFFNNT